MNSLKTLIVLFIVVLSTSVLNAQDTKMIKGRVISEDLEILPGAKIYNMDTTVLGSTDGDGYFEIEVPVETNELLLGFIGMEWTPVKIEGDCKNLEMIIMADVIYDFIPIKRINKRRQKRFKQLPKKHKEAYEKGIFKSGNPCVCYVFTEY
jgi:hypothetical protein